MNKYTFCVALAFCLLGDAFASGSIPGCGSDYVGIPSESVVVGSFPVDLQKFPRGTYLLYAGGEYQLKVLENSSSAGLNFHFKEVFDTQAVDRSHIEFVCLDNRPGTPIFSSKAQMASDIIFNLDGSQVVQGRYLSLASSKENLTARADYETPAHYHPLAEILALWPDAQLFKVGNTRYDLHLHRYWAVGQTSMTFEERMVVHFRLH